MSKSKNHRKEPLWTREFCILCAVVLAINVGMQMLNSILALYINSIGGSATITGAISIVFMFATLFGRTINGRICNSGHYKFSATLGASLFLIGMLPNLFIPSIGLLCVCRALQGYGYSGCGTAATAGSSFILPESRLGEGLGYIALSSALTIAIGPSIGLKLINGNDFRPAFLAIMAMCALCVFLVQLLKRGQPKSTPTAVPEEMPEPAKRGLWRVLEKGALPLCLVQFIISLACSAVNNYISLFANDRGFTSASLFFTCSAIGMILVRLISGKGVDRFHPLIMLAPSLALCCVCMVIFPSLTASSQLPYIGILFGLSNGMCIPLLSSIVMKHTPRNRRGSASATFYISVDLGIGAGSLIWGRVIDVFGFKTMFLSASACFLLALIVGTYILIIGERRIPTPVPISNLPDDLI